MQAERKLDGIVAQDARTPSFTSALLTQARHPLLDISSTGRTRRTGQSRVTHLQLPSPKHACRERKRGVGRFGLHGYGVEAHRVRMWKEVGVGEAMVSDDLHSGNRDPGDCAVRALARSGFQRSAWREQPRNLG